MVFLTVSYHVPSCKLSQETFFLSSYKGLVLPAGLSQIKLRGMTVTWTLARQRSYWNSVLDDKDGDSFECVDLLRFHAV